MYTYIYIKYVLKYVHFVLSYIIGINDFKDNTKLIISYLKL